MSPLTGPHWWIIAGLMSRTGARVTVPDYLLAAEHTFDESFPAVNAVVDHVLAGAGDHKVVLAGDSAGAGLALAQAIRCRDEATPAPSAVVLFSPWVDVTMSNPEARALEGRDVMLACDGLIAAGQWWAGDRSPLDPDQPARRPPAWSATAHDPPGREGHLPARRPPSEKARAGNDVVLQEAPGFAAGRSRPVSRTAMNYWSQLTPTRRASAGIR